MSEKKKQICPVFPDLFCPRGEDASKACQVRFNGDFDPMQDFRDQLLLECALYRSRQAEAKTGQEKKD